MAEIDWTWIVTPEEPEEQKPENEIDWTAYTEPKKMTAKTGQPSDNGDAIRSWLKSTYTGKQKIEDIPITQQLSERFERQKNAPQNIEPQELTTGEAVANSFIPALAGIKKASGKSYNIAGLLAGLVSDKAGDYLHKIGNPLIEESERMSAAAKQYAGGKGGEVIQDLGKGAAELAATWPIIKLLGLAGYSGIDAAAEVKAGGGSDKDAVMAAIPGAVTGKITEGMFDAWGKLKVGNPDKILGKITKKLSGGVATTIPSAVKTEIKDGKLSVGMASPEEIGQNLAMNIAFTPGGRGEIGLKELGKRNFEPKLAPQAPTIEPKVPLTKDTQAGKIVEPGATSQGIKASLPEVAEAHGGVAGKGRSVEELNRPFEYVKLTGGIQPDAMGKTGDPRINLQRGEPILKKFTDKDTGRVTLEIDYMNGADTQKTELIRAQYEAELNKKAPPPKPEKVKAPDDMMVPTQTGMELEIDKGENITLIRHGKNTFEAHDHDAGIIDLEQAARIDPKLKGELKNAAKQGETATHGISERPQSPATTFAYKNSIDGKYVEAKIVPGEIKNLAHKGGATTEDLINLANRLGCEIKISDKPLRGAYGSRRSGQAGFYDMRIDLDPGDINNKTLAHELGHFIFSNKKSMKPWERVPGSDLVRGEWKAVESELGENWSGQRKYHTTQKERYPKLFSLYLTNPVKLRKISPGLYNKMERLIDDMSIKLGSAAASSNIRGRRNINSHLLALPDRASQDGATETPKPPTMNKLPTPEAPLTETPGKKISQVVTNTFAKEFGGKDALELSKDFAEYDVRDKMKAPRELLNDGIELTANKLIAKEKWDEYDYLKANAVRENAIRNAKSPDDLRKNNNLLEIMRRSKEGLSKAGKVLETAREIDPISEPIRAAEQKLNEQIKASPKLSRAKRQVSSTLKRLSEVIGRPAFSKLDDAGKRKAIESVLGKDRTAPPQFDITQKIIEMSRAGIMNEPLLAEFVAKKIGVPLLTPEHMFKIGKQAQKIESMPEGTPELNDAKIDAMADLYGMLYSDVPKTRTQKIMDARVLGLLLNGKSAERNVIGQGGDNTVTTIAREILGIPADIFITNRLSKKIGIKQERTMGHLEFKTLIRGMFDGFRRSWKDIGNNRDTLKFRLEKEFGIKLGKEADKFGVAKAEWKPGGIMDKAQRGVAYLLQAPDTAFQEGVFRESFKNQINALRPETRANVTQDMRQRMADQAWSEASQITYRKMNKFSQAVVDLQRRTGTIGKLLLTFPKVASNIIYTGAYKYGPVGLGVTMNRMRKFIKSGGVETVPKRASDVAINQRQLAFDFARGGIGSSIVALGVLAGYNGLITGGKEDDTALQKTKEARGEQPGSVKINGHYYRLDWIQPIFIPFELGAEIGKALKAKNAGDTLENTINLLTRAASTIADQPLTTTIQRVVNAPGKNLGEKMLAGTETFASSAASSFIPTLSGQGRQIVDKYQRSIQQRYGKGQVNQLKSFMFATAALIANKIPVLSTLLEKRKDIFGRDLEYHQSDNFLLDVLDRLGNPSIITNAKKEPGIDFILKLNADKPAEMTEKPIPRNTENTWYIERDKKRYYFTPKQKSKYQELVGKDVYDFVNDYYNRGLGEGVPVEEQIKEIYNEIGNIGKYYRELMLEEMGPKL